MKQHGTNHRARREIRQRNAVLERAERLERRRERRRMTQGMVDGPEPELDEAAIEADQAAKGEGELVSREPIVAVFSVRITLRGPEHAETPTVRELADRLGSGLAWPYVSTIEGERVDR